MAEAYRRPATVVIETIHVSRNGVRRLKRRRPLDPDGAAGLRQS